MTDWQHHRDQVLRDLDQRCKATSERLTSMDAGLKAYGDALHGAVAGGKLFRPQMVLLGAGVAELSKHAVALASATELLHAMALVHDDIMDKATVRRGSPATHVQLAPGDNDHDRHTGTSSAILVGDLLLVMADDAAMPALCEVGPALQKIWRDLREEVIAGQLLDVSHPRDAAPTSEGALAIADLKTASYTVTRPLQLGLCLAGATAATLAAAERVTAPLGRAFQLRDDLLGFSAEEIGSEALGKPAQADIRERKPTYVAAAARAALPPADQAAFDEAWLTDANDTSDALIIKAIRASGAIDVTENKISELEQQALAAIEADAIPVSLRTPLAELTDLLLHRLY